jgi:hypothetical protein
VVKTLRIIAPFVVFVFISHEIIKKMEKIIKKSLVIGLILEVAVLILAYVEATDVTTFFQCAARLSGRVSLLLFSFVVYYFSSNWKESIENQ